jgi:hypothetical protein
MRREQNILEVEIEIHFQDHTGYEDEGFRRREILRSAGKMATLRMTPRERLS